MDAQLQHLPCVTTEVAREGATPTPPLRSEAQRGRSRAKARGWGRDDTSESAERLFGPLDARDAIRMRQRAPSDVFEIQVARLEWKLHRR